MNEAEEAISGAITVLSKLISEDSDNIDTYHETLFDLLQAKKKLKSVGDKKKRIGFLVGGS